MICYADNMGCVLLFCKGKILGRVQSQDQTNHGAGLMLGQYPLCLPKQGLTGVFVFCLVKK